MILAKKQKNIFTLVSIAVFAGIIFIANNSLGSYTLRILNLSAIYIILALSLNLVNGFTGLFSLGHAGFMAVGAYTSALLTMSPTLKETTFFLQPIAPFLANVQLPFPVALLCAGLMAAFVGFLVGWPVLRLRDDYLAIATLGFSEIIRVVLTNLQPITNGAQGLRGLPRYSTTYVVWFFAFAAIVFMVALINSAFGRSCRAIRDNEIAAQAMGINVARVKITSFVISCFMAGVGGALLGHMQTAIDPMFFRFVLTYHVLLIVVLGGTGSITGSVIGALLVIVSMEWLRFLDGPLNLIFIQTRGAPGLRMVVFSLLLLTCVIFRQQGLMGNKEFSWDAVAGGCRKIKQAAFFIGRKIKRTGNKEAA
ncbi:MAG: branched-chain amino acid ABC transporter permease [Treponema sp.]|jgi:branched-chain amino acid transport system permease protein|nr:branched-chain amino acid ABC transporter permease [Treponema sp.]